MLGDISSGEAMIVKLISDDLDVYILFKQFENSEIIKREISAAGCYCYFRHKTILEKSKNNGFVGNVNLMLSNESIGGAMFFRKWIFKNARMLFLAGKYFL